MYTIGQVSSITGISRDKLRYYEEKGILKPVQNDENNYRQYDDKDIDNILSIEVYRSLDLDFKTIEGFYKKSSIKESESILDKKRNDVVNEINRLKGIVKRIDKTKEGYNDIKKYLNKYTVRPMPPIEILGEISAYRAYDEYTVVQKNRNELQDNSIMKGMRRYMTFDNERMTDSKMLIVKDLEDGEDEGKSNILKYEKCVYTIFEDGYIKGCSPDIVMKREKYKSEKYMYDHNYKHKNIAILRIIAIEPTEEGPNAYTGVYIPIQ